MTEIFTHTVPLEQEAKTFPAELRGDFNNKTQPLPFIDSCEVSSASLSFAATNSAMPLLSNKFATSKTGTFSDSDKKITTSSVKFSKSAPKVKTARTKFTVQSPAASKKIQIQPVKLESSYSAIIDAKPQTREMINLKFIPYPKISDIIIRIAEENKLSYTQVQLIGIYDPVPLHLASGMTLDTFTGKLRFFVKNDPKAQKRFARVAYARVRSTGEIVQTTFPVS